MSQAETLERADSAAEVASEAVASSPKSLTETMDDSLLRALGIEQEDDQPAEEEEPEPEEEEPAAAELPEEDSTPDEPPSEDRLSKWVGEVAANANNLDRIPPRHHKAVVEALIAEHNDVNRRAVEQAVAQGYQRGVAEAETRAKAMAEVQRLDTMADEEPEEFIRWQRQYPDRAAAYFAIKQQGDAPPVPQENPYIVQARVLFAKLEGNKEAYDRVAGKAAQLKPDADGVAQLASLVADELAEIKAAAARKPDPAAQQLEKRRNAQTERRSVPRPDVGTGRTGPTEELPEDPLALIAMGFKEDLKRSGAMR